MSSAWGASWSRAWGDSWGVLAAVITPVVPTQSAIGMRHSEGRRRRVPARQTADHRKRLKDDEDILMLLL